MTISENVYRILLKAYPHQYQVHYAEPMHQLFRDKLGEVRTFGGLAALWVRTLGDWAVSVLVQYSASPTPHLHLSSPARQCIFLARSEASSFSSHEIKLEHLLLGVLRQEPSLVPDAGALVRAVEANEQCNRRIPPMEDLRLSRETIRAWEGAKEIAQAAGRQQVAPRDLAAGILRETDSLAARLLREHRPNPS